MKTQSCIGTSLLALILTLAPAGLLAQNLRPLQLPPPQTDIGRPLMQALKDRSSTRAFGPQKLSPQTLSNLLWAAFGVNRTASGKRTAPSAMNWQETTIYLALPDGVYTYNAAQNALDPVSSDDVRAQTGTQGYVKEAAVDLVYVAALARTGRASAERDLFVGADAGVIAQNVYLFCASEGLATVVRGSIDRPALAKVLHLRAEQRITLAQSVGYARK